jgi:hypothetical protein
MRVFATILLVSAICAGVFPPPAQAETRIALLIGNKDYKPGVGVRVAGEINAHGATDNPGPAYKLTPEQRAKMEALGYEVQAGFTALVDASALCHGNAFQLPLTPDVGLEGCEGSACRKTRPAALDSRRAAQGT